MKKLLAALLVLAMLLMGVAALAEEEGHELALVTDVGNIDDQSFNQSSYEGMVAFAEENGLTYAYYRPSEDSTDARVESMRAAVENGAKVIVCPGYLFEDSVYLVQDEYPDVNFLLLDGEPHSADYAEYRTAANTHCILYREEQAGFFAGYAAVKEGYTELGFAGGMAVPAVIRYGYGFVQGVDAAAADLGLSDVTVKYVYGGQFFGDADITAVMDTWYAGGTEVVFACGGGIYTSAVDAAKKANGKVIGVDVDQAGVIANYAGVDGLTVTSAMKGLYPATYDTLNDVIINGNWANYVGQIATLGLVSADDPEANYVQIPMGEGTQWSDSFTQDDYKAMVADMYNGVITVSNDISKAASDFATVITVDDQGAIKG